MPRPALAAVLAATLAACAAGCRGEKAETDRAAPAEKRSETPSPIPPGAALRFADVTPGSGVDFVHVTGTDDTKPFPAANGSGLAILDFDRDGAADLFFASGTPFPQTGPAAGLPGEIDPAAPTDALFRGLGGETGTPRFARVPAVAGVDGPQYSAGVAVGDYDGDGFPDLYVTAFGPNRLYRNNGDGTFALTEQARDTDANPAGRWGTGAAFFDADGDGNLDLYAGNYAVWDPATARVCGDPAAGRASYCRPTTVEPAGDVFYANAGDGGFADRTAAAGFAAAPAGRSMGVVAVDLEPDGDADLYVACDVNPNPLFVNGAAGAPAGTFAESGTPAGAAYDRRGNMNGGMGVAAGDADGDGRIDLAVTNYADEHLTLYRARPGDYYEDAGGELNLEEGTRPWIGWGTALIDLDGDGDDDLVVANGHTDEEPERLGLPGPRLQPAQLYRAESGGDGAVATFTDLAASAGDYFAAPHAARGLATGFLNDDFLPDLAIGHQDAAPALLTNATPGAGPVVRVRLVGTTANRDAVGATVYAAGPAGNDVVRPVVGGGSYLSASDPRLTLPAPGGAATARVLWPGGGEQTFADLAAGGDYLLIQNGPAVRLE